MRYIVLLVFAFAAWLYIWLEKQNVFNIDDDEYEIFAQKRDAFDLDSIQKRKKLVALTRYNANSFFIYRGQPMGYEYELLQLFAKEINVDLEIKIPTTHDSLFIMLKNGQGDLIAANLPITKEKNEHVLFSKHHNTTRQVLVQRLPENHRFMTQKQMKDALISDPIELIEKTVTVHENSAFHKRLENLSNEIGGDIFINPSPYEQEDLIGMVSRGEIEYTVADENLAELNMAYYKNIDVSVAVSFSQRLAWAFRDDSPKLKKAADEWLTKFRRGGNFHYNLIYNKYYGNSSQYNVRRSSDYFVLETGAISPYDSLFKKYEKPPLIPWTLLASMAYQESRFDNSAESWMGAKGVMQIMPRTAEYVKVRDIHLPENNIKAGVKYLQDIHKNYWKNMKDTSEMIKFLLGSYNAGPGHVEDAQRLAASLGLDTLKWDDNVAVALRKLSNPEYYYRPDIKYGYCRGEEPFLYVKEVMERKRMYDGSLEAAAARKAAAETAAEP